MLRLVLAVLFRAGTIEVSHGGEKFTSYQDPRCRVPFTNNTAFKSALFTPVKPIDLKTLTRAVECYETLTGETVDVDKNAIAEALKRFATEELKQVVPIEADAKANRLPILGPIQEYRESLAAIGSGSPDDCVETLVGSGTSLKESHDRLKKIAECLNEAGLATIRQARTAVEQMWPQLETRGQSELAPKAEELKSLLSNEAFFESLPAIKSAADEIQTAYYGLYEKTHDTRTKQFDQAIEKIKGRPEWSDVPENMREPVLSPLVLRSCADNGLAAGRVGLPCLQGHHQPDGIRHAGLGRAVRPGTRANSEDNDTARSQDATGSGCRLLHGADGQRREDQAGRCPFAGSFAEAVG